MDEYKKKLKEATERHMERLVPKESKEYMKCSRYFREK